MNKATAFTGTDRYELDRPIGEGSYGVVYRAFDRVRREPVALKLLRRRGGERLIAFKREFRALADVTHPNLVELYELVAAHDAWFFTMELLEGMDFLDHIHRQDEASVRRRAVATTLVADDVEVTHPTPRRRPAPRPPSPDLQRLRESFAQLVDGTRALHRSGQLHRDLKPSNAMVTGEGRVVLLDFGLVTDVGDAAPPNRRLEGTLPYMSPEQCAGQPLTPASDFYAVGVMLYEALTGQWPFTGNLQGVLRNKQRQDPIPPSSLAEVPAELDALCMRLLSREPNARPDADAILGELGVEGAPPSSTWSNAPRRTGLVGRREELAALDRAFAEAGSGVPVALFVHGRSGMGKSALIDHFTERLEREHRAVVVRGACYQRESVPYKALDSLMDALCGYLERLPEPRARQLVPGQARALARLFPVLERVAAFAIVPGPASEVAELDALRRRAVDALRELMNRMCDDRPLVICVDDVQWGDADSARLLRDLIDEGCPPVMMIFGCRRQSRRAGPFMETLNEALERRPEVLTRHLEIGPLSMEESVGLIGAVLADADIPDLNRLSRQLAGEAGGNPFFIRELADYVLTDSARSISSGLDVGLTDLLVHRLDALDADARSLLEVIAVAGHPISETLARRAAGLSDARPSTAALRGARFARLDWQPAASELDTRHARIREAVLDSLDDDRLADTHERLAEAYLERGRRGGEEDVDAIAHHLEGAGQLGRAADYTVRAAARAFDQLAFEQAVELYRQALELRPSTLSRSELHERLAEALARSGRGPDAARSYLRAEKDASRNRQTALRCHAAQQYFFSGHIDRATELFHQVLAATELPPLPRTEAGALLSFARRRTELKLRGLRFELRDPHEIRDADLVRTDVCYSVSAVLAGVRPLVASSLQTHHLLLALRLGEPFRLTRGLALEAIFSAMAGPSAAPRTQELLAAAAEVSDAMPSPAAEAVVSLATGVCAFFMGSWRRAVSTLERTEELITTRCPGMAFELRQVQSFLGLARFYTGDYAEAGRRARPVLQDVRNRGDRYAESMLVNVSYRSHLFAGRLQAARQEVARGLQGWYRGGTAIQDYYESLALARIALYEADGRRADNLARGSLSSVLRSSMGRVQLVRLETHQLRGQAALLRAQQSKGRKRHRLLRRVEAAAHRLEREDASYGKPWAMLLRAGVVWLRGHKAQARVILTDAEHACRQLDLAGHAAAARWQRAQIDGGTSDEALAWMQDQQIAEPEQFAGLIVPGFERRP